MKPNDYKSVFETLQLDDRTLAMSHGETITPQPIDPTPKLETMRSLPEFRTDDGASAAADYRIISTLGEGGMGVVSLAEQTALRRLVAVKKPKANDARTHGRVLEEAFVMGRMEHPNVVPAYGLGRLPDGRPILVMKRVDGTSWADVLSGAHPAPGGESPDITWHLRVLLQICNALRFAHAHHVVHRDLKPENVMIGEFGEVYLLDWGLAVSLDPDSAEGFPVRESCRGLAGTPAFMAPEMTGDDASDIDERTDIYLLGATLHLILTGAPPHSGGSLFEVMMSAHLSEPFAYADGVPTELAAIAHRAMAREKADRYPSVGAFATAVNDFLEHRASHLLSDAAWDTLNQAAGPTDADLLPRVLESEFGFRHALAIWANNESAQRGLQSAIEWRARTCIAREEVRGARAAIDQLPAPNPQLEAELADLQAKLAARADRVDYLERFELELDLKTGTRSRQRAVIVLGIGFVAFSFHQAWTLRPGQPAPELREMAPTYLITLLVAATAIGLFWRKLFGNVANRRLMVVFGSALLFVWLLRFAAIDLEPPVVFVQLAQTAVIGTAAFATAANTSRRLAVFATGYIGACIVGVLTRQMWLFMLAMGVAHLGFFGFMAWLWRPSLTRKAEGNP